MQADDYVLFLKVASFRSLSEASEGLGISVATLARRLHILEADLGFKVFIRTPRGLTLTDYGVTLRAEGRELLEELSRLSHVTRNLGAGGEVATVKVSATEPVIAEILAPHLLRLLSVKPAPRVDLRVENQLASVSLGAADIAVRLVAPTDDNLVAYKLASVNFGLYASPDYVASLGPLTEAWTEQIDVLAYDDAHGAINELAWLQKAGLGHRIVASTSSTRALLEAAAGGAGVALLPEHLARKRGLVELSPPDQLSMPEREVWLVWHRSMSSHPPIRRVVDWVKDAFHSAFASSRH